MYREFDGGLEKSIDIIDIPGANKSAAARFVSLFS
jgi:hypothetical protein